jgi:hypothetical protein
MRWLDQLIVITASLVASAFYPRRFPPSVIAAHTLLVAILSVIAYQQPPRKKIPTPPKSRSRQLTKAQQAKLDRALRRLK